MAGLRSAWESVHGPGSVVGLAPSATAAEVLAEQVGIPTENTAKWLVENARNSQRLTEINTLRGQLYLAPPSKRTSRLRDQLDTLRGEVRRWSLRAGQLVIVDEASLAGTFTLDALVRRARTAGAKVVLVGDWAQLSPVEAGGAFHLLTRDRKDVAELCDVRRFHQEWERTASVDLRIGIPDAADTYQAHGRVEGDDRELMLERVYAAWSADVAAGKRSLMIAGDNQTVADLNRRAQADRVTAGQVHTGGVPTAGGVVVGVGDLVNTRRNDRRLATGTGWVKNGDRWVVTAPHPDGAVTVTRLGSAGTTRGHVTLPVDYVRDHVDLGYATTAHGAQGQTVDTAHAYITATTRREVLYVAATRGRDSNRLYVDTCYDPDTDTAHQPTPERGAADVLRQVIATPGADTSATETIAATWTEHHSITRLWAEYQTITATVLRDRYDNLITNRSGLTTQQAETIRRSPSYGALVAALGDAQTRGLDVDTTLPRMIAGRTLDDADDTAAVLHERVDRWIHSTPIRRQQVPDRIVGLLRSVDAGHDPDIQQALDERRQLIEQRTRRLTEQALERGDPWLAPLCTPPTEPVPREHWLRTVDTVTAYRQRWDVTSRSALDEDPTTLEQATDLRLARQAAEDTRRYERPRQPLAWRSRLPEHRPGRRGPEF